MLVTARGILYGSSVAAIGMTLNITKDQAQAIIDAYFEVFPRIKDFVDNAHKMARENFYVYSPFGQRKREFGAMDLFRNTAVFNAALRNSQNVMIQGPASTLGLMSFAKLNEELKKIGGGAMCTVYDSIECYVPFNRVAEAIELGFYCMDDWPVKEFAWLDFPIGADAEIGFDWGDSLKHVHRGITQTECLELLKLSNPVRYLEEVKRAA